LAAARPGSGTR